MASPCASYALQLEGRYDYYAIPIAKSGAFRTALAQHTALARRGLGENCGGAVPVHPRDLLSGHYVALRYLIASPSTPDCKALLAARLRGCWKRGQLIR